MDLRPVERVEDLLAASELFDQPALRAASERFVSTPGHFMFLAYERGEPAGFVSGVEMIHPDKGAEMFLYELGVAEPFRGVGVATALVARLRELARERGCYGMWVLTDDDNAAALSTYRRAGASDPESHVLLEWALSKD
jgi:ribosomal protein S18 acetylase RimI-like enzyme